MQGFIRGKWNLTISCQNTQEPRKFPGGACHRTPLQPCAFVARSESRSVLILDPRLEQVTPSFCNVPHSNTAYQVVVKAVKQGDRTPGKFGWDDCAAWVLRPLCLRPLFLFPTLSRTTVNPLKRLKYTANFRLK